MFESRLIHILKVDLIQKFNIKMNTFWKVIKLGGTSQCLQGYLNIERIIKNKNLNEKYVFVL